jgi:hypothetical protein
VAARDVTVRRCTHTGCVWHAHRTQRASSDSHCLCHRSYRATHTQAPDFAYALVAARAAAGAAAGTFDAAALDLSALRCCLNGAEAARPATQAAFAASFAASGLLPHALGAGYGLAEHTVYVCDGGRRVIELDRSALQSASRRIASPPAPDVPPADVLRLLSCGRPAMDDAGGEVAIVDPATRLRLPRDAVGEIWLSGPSVAAGYWAQPQLTQARRMRACALTAHSCLIHSLMRTPHHALCLQEVFRARLASEPAGALWLRTGDLGFLSSAAAFGVEGELFFVGRAKDVIVVRGRNVAPEDIERAAAAAAPALRPGCAAAFALEEPGGGSSSSSGGKEEGVVLVCEVRDARLSGAAAGAAVAAVRAAVAAVGVTLAHVALLPPRSIPKTTSGKVRRFECRRRFQEGSLPTIAAAAAAQHGVLAHAAPGSGAAASGGGEAARREGMLQPGSAAALGALPRRRRRAALQRAIARHVAAAWSLPLPAPHTDLMASGLDSAAAAALHGALELSLGAPLPRTLLLDARTPAALALAAEAACWPPCAADDAADAADAAAAWETGDDDDIDACGGGGATSAATAAAHATPAQRRAGAALALFCAGVLLAHVASMAQLRAPDDTPLRWWSTQPPAYITGAGYRPGWLPGPLSWRSVDVAHWRLLEWARTVLPIQLGLNGGAAALARAAAALTADGGAARGWRRAVPSQRALAAVAGLAHATALHGVWALPLLALVLANFALAAACRRCFRGGPRARAVRAAAAWALALAPMAVYNALEPGNLLWRHTSDAAASAERRFLCALLGVGARPYEGLLAATSFTANRTFRYIAIRCLSYHMDDSEEEAEQHGGAAAGDATFTAANRRSSGEGWFGELELFLAYVLYAPLYLCGPVMTFKAFKASPAAQGGAAAAASRKPAAAVAAAAVVISSAVELRVQPPAEETLPPPPLPPPLHPFPSARQAAARAPQAAPAGHAAGWRAAAVAAGGAVACAVALEVALHGVYAPSAVFYPSFSHGSRALAAALRPWDWAVYAFAFLTATWLTSAIVFAVPRGIAAAARVAAPHDTPLWWTTASVSCRKHWAHFHASLFNVFMRYIFLPLGGGTRALLATVAFSTFIHGFHTHWALWGLGNALTLAAERAAARRWRWYASPGAPVRAANQAAAVTLMAALALGGELPPGALRSVAAFTLAFAALNAAYLGR